MRQEAARCRFLSSCCWSAGGRRRRLCYMTSVPGTSHQGALPPLTAEERALAATLKRHIETIAARRAQHRALRRAGEGRAPTSRRRSSRYGYTVGRQEFVADGKTVRNIDAVIEPPRGVTRSRSGRGRRALRQRRGHAGRQRQRAAAPPRCSNWRGCSRDLQGKTRKRIRLVLFVNEEPPYFQTEDMGSLRYAKALAARKERVTAMYSLETLGYYSDAPGSQNYPLPFGLMFPDRGDFVSFVGLTQFAAAGAGDDALVPRAHVVSDASAASRRASSRASAGPTTGLSPSTAFRRVMVTDTAIVPLSALSRADRHAGQGRHREAGARREGHASAWCAIWCAAVTASTSTPPVIGRGTPVVVGNVSGRPLSERTARNAKACASSASADQPTSIGGLDAPRARARSASIRISVGLRAPPPATIQRCGARGRIATHARDRRGGERRQRRGAVLGALLVKPACAATHSRKSLRSSDFGGGCAKNGCASSRAIAASSTRPAAAARPSSSTRRAGARAHEIVDQRIAGPVSQAIGSSRHR